MGQKVWPYTGFFTSNLGDGLRDAADPYK